MRSSITNSYHLHWADLMPCVRPYVPLCPKKEKVRLEPSESDQEDWDEMSTGGKVLFIISMVVSALWLI